MDTETDLYYYGARYMNPVASIWYGVDIMSESKPDICSFMYCLGNPIDLIDPDGNWERGSNGYLIAQKGDNAVTLAQFTGTCAKEALNLLLANGITVNGKGILNLQIGQRIKSNVLEEVLIYARRSNKVTISQPATNKTNSDTPWMTVAQSQLGQTEIKGHRNNPQIVAYHASTTLQAKTDEVAWCSSFVNWTLKQVGIQGTNSASSQSRKHWGQRLKRPVYGCIAILSHKGGGHVAFVAGINKNGRLVLLGGNQHDTVNYSAFKGNMVFVYPKGYMPSSDPLPKSSVNSRSLSLSETR